MGMAASFEHTDKAFEIAFHPLCGSLSGRGMFQADAVDDGLMSLFNKEKLSLHSSLDELEYPYVIIG